MIRFNLHASEMERFPRDRNYDAKTETRTSEGRKIKTAMKSAQPAYTYIIIVCVFSVVWFIRDTFCHLCGKARRRKTAVRADAADEGSRFPLGKNFMFIFTVAVLALSYFATVFFHANELFFMRCVCKGALLLFLCYFFWFVLEW